MVTIIINPISGARRDTVSRRAHLASSLLESSGEEGQVFLTERRGHARELAAAAVVRGSRLVLAWGGDGTINEVGSALIFGDVPLAIVPSGSGNGLARELQVARRPEQAIVDALGAPARAIDAGELGGRYFFNMAGIGFDAHVAARFDTPGRRGLATYVRISARELLAYRSAAYRIAEVADADTSALLVALANSPQFGNGARIAPAARLDDGRLDLVVYSEVSRFATFCALPRLFTGGIGSVRGVSIQQIERATIESDKPMTFHVDGEPVQGGTRLEARVHPGALQVCVR